MVTWAGIQPIPLDLAEGPHAYDLIQDAKRVIRDMCPDHLQESLTFHWLKPLTSQGMPVTIRDDVMGVMLSPTYGVRGEAG